MGAVRPPNILGMPPTSDADSPFSGTITTGLPPDGSPGEGKKKPLELNLASIFRGSDETATPVCRNPIGTAILDAAKFSPPLYAAAWLYRSVDRNDLRSVRRIVGHLIDHPTAVGRNIRAFAAAAASSAWTTFRAGLDEQTPPPRPPDSIDELTGFIGFLGGLVVGAVQELIATLEMLYNIAVEGDEFVDHMLSLMEKLLAPNQESVWRQMGEQAGENYAQDYFRIANLEDSMERGYESGKVLGPYFVELLLAILTAGAGAAVSGSRRLTQILRALRRLPGGPDVLDNIAASRRAGRMANVPDAALREAEETVARPAAQRAQR